MEPKQPDEPSALHRVLRIFFRGIKWLLIGIVLLAVAIIVAFLLPPVQKYALRKGTAWFNQTTGGELTIQDIDIRLPYFIHLEGVQLYDPDQNQIVAADELRVSLGWRMIFNKTIRLDRIELSGLNANLISDNTGKWNYDFIAAAFSDSTAAPDTSTAGSSWDVSIGAVRLDDTQFKYFDGTTRDSIDTEFGSINVVFNRFTLNEMVFLAESISLKDSKSFVQLGPPAESADANGPPTPAEQTETNLPEFAVARLELANHSLGYRTSDESLAMHLSLGEMNATSKEIDLENNKYHLGSVALHGTTFDMKSISSEPADTTTFDYDIFIPFDISVDELNASGNKVHITTEDVDKIVSVTDLHGIAFQISDLNIKPDLYALEAESISVSYGDDLKISNLSLAFNVEPTSVEVSGLDLKFGQSAIKGNFDASFESIQKLIEKASFDHLALDIPTLRLHPAELESIYRLAGIHDTSRVSIPSMLTLSTRIAGNRQKIDVPLLDAQMGKSSISIKGTSSGPELARHQVSLRNIDLLLNLDDIASFLPADLDLSPYPKTYELNGAGKASPESAELRADLQMDIGKIEIDANTGGWDAESFPINGTIRSEMLNLSRITGFDSLLVVFDMDADLQDVTTEDRYGNLTLDLHEVDYGPYTLNNTYAQVDVAGDVYKYILEINDSSAVLVLGGQATMGDTLKLTADGDIKGIDLEYLGITKKDFRTQLHFKAEYQMVDSFMWGDLLVDRTTVIKEDKRTDFDPITASFALLADSTGAEISSEWINMKASSNLVLEEIATHIRALFKDNPDDDIRKDGYLKIDVKTADSEIIGDIFPEIKAFAPSFMSVDYSANTAYIDAKARFPKIRYEAIEIDSLNLDMQGSAGTISGAFGIGRLAYDSLAMQGIRLGLTPADEGNDFSFQINNGMDTAQYYFHANIKHVIGVENPFWKIDPGETFVLDGKEWAVDPLAQIILKDSLYGIEDFSLSRKKNFLSVHTPMEDDVLHLKATNFSLVYISKLFTLEQNLLEGRLNLDMDVYTDGTFEGKADINGLNIFGADFGRFDIIAEAKNGSYKVDAQVEGPAMDMEAKGSLKPIDNDNASVDIKAFLTRFDFKSLNRLFPSVFASSEGIATGALDLNGTTADPLLSGKLKFKDITMQMVNNRARYNLRDEEIKIEPNEILFPAFTLRDSASNKMVVDGKIRHNFFRDQEYNLTIKSDNFTLVDLLPGDDPFVYGKLIVGTDINISGTDRIPIIRSDIALKRGSGIVFQMPEEEYDDMSFDGLVEWVSFDEQIRETNRIIDAQKSKQKTVQESSSLDLSGALKIDPETNLKIIIDPLAGDNINLKGGGTLGIGYDRSGQLSLNGTYRVSSGSYEMTFYNIVKRSFSISQGSTIMWNGDPYNPVMSITAVYKTRIPLASLMGSQAGAAATNESLRRPADFELHMTLTGGLDQTDVAFAIKLGEKSRGMLSGAADARVAQINENETELNRQVFAMLVLNTFVNDAAPTSGGEALANEARNSASQILTNQLNTLTDKFIGGAVDLNFDMMSYQGASGTAETDLSIDVSKSLFNERIVIKVGSTVPIEGNNTAGANGSNELITNIIVEYKITPDGRYNFKVFRKEDLDDILVGRLTRTGVGIMFRREFDSNSDIFKLTEEEIELNKALKEKEEQKEK